MTSQPGFSDLHDHSSNSTFSQQSVVFVLFVRCIIFILATYALYALYPRRYLLILILGFGKLFSDLIQKPKVLNQSIRNILLRLGVDVRSWDMTPESPGSFQRLSRMLKSLSLGRFGIADRKDVNEYLVSKYAAFQKPLWFIVSLEYISPHSIFTYNGQLHREKRRMIVRSLASKFYSKLVAVSWSKTQLLNSQLMRRLHATTTQSSVIELSSWTYRFITDVSGESLFDYDCGLLADGGEKSDLLHLHLSQTEGSSLLEFVCHRLLVTFLPFHWIYKLPIAEIKMQEFGKKCLFEFSRKVRTKRQLKRNEAGQVEDTDAMPDFLDTVFNGSQSSDEIDGHIITMITASSHTLTSTMTFALHYLASNLSVQRKLREEIYNYIPDPAIELTPNHLRSMTYLNAVFSEVLRLEPAARSIPRIAVRDADIGNMHVLAGEELLAPVRSIHRREDVWGEDAQEFRPERWIDDISGRGGATDKTSFMPFSHGPRSCVGREYAMNEGKIFLVGLVGAFELELVDGHRELRYTLPTPLNMLSYVRTIKGRLHLKLQPVEGKWAPSA
ncbi:cytochrome P450 [Rhizodiscina lignyota]|uniref:Cytochrome P450 n=1 Tax=Rhizodiscina lignyota TaxID=1504668 RepID=A0A9P4INR5_9PEZI|nr:cytochrome P450 [Rhizodiscina lignyota]